MRPRRRVNGVAAALLALPVAGGATAFRLIQL